MRLLVSKDNCGQVYLWRQSMSLISNLDTHTHTFIWGMGTSSAPVVSDLCKPITQVIQWVTIKETQLETLHSEGANQSVTMQCFIIPLYRSLWGCRTSQIYAFASDKRSKIFQPGCVQLFLLQQESLTLYLIFKHISDTEISMVSIGFFLF